MSKLGSFRQGWNTNRNKNQEMRTLLKVYRQRQSICSLKIGKFMKVNSFKCLTYNRNANNCKETTKNC